MSTRRVSVSLAWKMTSLFALFGVLISYLGLVIYGTLATSALVDSASAVLRSYASLVLPDRSDAAFASLIGSRSGSLLDTLTGGFHAAQGEGLDALSVYVRPARSPGEWSRALAAQDGRLILGGVDPRDARSLDRLILSGDSAKTPLFMGRADRIKVFVDLSRPGDAWLVALELRLSPALALTQVQGHSGIILFGIGLWFLLWLGLSQLFGRRLARPVRSLAIWAEDRSRAISFRDLVRGDEIGSLARSLIVMNNEIEDERKELSDRARALESMNRIDRAVLGTHSRPDLFSQVLGAVLEYSHAELGAVMVRDPDGGGYSIVARLLSGEGGTPASGFVEDDDIPSALLIRFADPFEVGLVELGGSAGLFLPESLLRDRSPKDLEDLRFVNLPFTVAGLRPGSLYLVRRRGGPALARLALLADQAGVALKDLEQREESERNWRAVVTSLVRAVDAKSAWTRGHSERVAALSRGLGECLLMGEAELARLDFAAVLHDVGKIGVPEYILDKPGKLTDEEYDLVKRHPVIGGGIVDGLSSYSSVRAAILHHHERWDGSGYPEGLGGEEIPLGARIIALCDVYDAVTDERPYRRGMGPAEARAFIAAASGSLFDPRLCRLFLGLLDAGLPSRYQVLTDQRRRELGMDPA